MEQQVWKPTTRLQKRIAKALEAKGYICVEAFWTPIAPGGEMQGLEGGWEVSWATKADDFGDIFGYNIDEVMAEIISLPVITP
ncbi:hypothetical protein [Tumebacillus lipolyticus]|uniref:Uncharacterized protein n=1 Tax=Tumebacillus lipolyticus TaxID=1280370 RepID=A0ABW5A451_9BACL